MVSFWPFGRRDDNSPDSFERILSQLATKIQAQTTKLNRLRVQARRYKALWTVYTLIAWMFYLIVLFLVVGMGQLRAREITIAAGAPVIIYTGRRTFVLIYERRISATEAVLAELVEERTKTIEKLKTATKFNTTQSLLEKYGGGSEITDDGMMSRQASSMGGHMPGQAQLRQQQQQQHQQQGSLRGTMPPAISSSHVQQKTARVPQAKPDGPTGWSQDSPLDASLDPVPDQPLTPQQLAIQEQLRAQRQLRPVGAPGQLIPPTSSNRPSPEPPGTAPHIVQSFPQTGNYLTPETAGSVEHHWYDRFLDVLLGEDETAAKNRYALICTNPNCRMVNGLAPPGCKSLEDVGKWGCARCGAMNGRAKPKSVMEEVEREIAPELLKNSVKRGSGRNRGSIRGWTKQVQNEQALHEVGSSMGEEEEDDDEQHDESDGQVGAKEVDVEEDELPVPKVRQRKTRGKKT